MDATLTTIANITQILSFIWLVLLGSKTLFDVIKLRKYSVKRLLLINIVLTLIILLISSAFLSTHRNATPVSLPSSQNSVLTQYKVLIKPDLPLPIPCKLACASKLTLILRELYNTPTNMDLTFTLTNKGTSECSMIPKELKLIDSTGQSSDAQGGVKAVGIISPNQTLIATAHFTVKPDNLYSLHSVLACTEHETMIYQTEQFSFGTVENDSQLLDNKTVDGTLNIFCLDIQRADFGNRDTIFTSALLGKVSETSVINTFGEETSCKINSTNENGSTSTASITLTNPENQKSAYQFSLIHTTDGWKIQSWKQQ